MIVIVDEREAVMEGYRAWFDREGVAATGLSTADFDNWVKTVSEPDILAVEAFLLGDCRDRHVFPKLIKVRSPAPVIAMNDAKSLEETLDLFAAGVDDVVRKPVHVREILARIKAIRGRVQAKAEGTVVGDCACSTTAGSRSRREVLACPPQRAFSSISSTTRAAG
jgi:DNA-binding response OmpR family regulator